MERLKSLEIGARIALENENEEQLKGIARDRVLVKRSLTKIVRDVENQRMLAEALERAIEKAMRAKGGGRNPSSSSGALPYETEEEIEEKFRKLEREANRRNLNWIDGL